MNSNYLPNCYCCSSLCICRELAGLPRSDCCPPTCCCCPVCRRNSRKLSKMSVTAKPKVLHPAVTATATAAAAKTVSKPKSKTIKTKKVTRSDKPTNQNDKRGSSQSQNGSSSKSDKLRGSHHSLHTSSSSLKTINSPRLEATDSKQKLNLNIPLSKNQEENYSVSSERSQGSHVSRSNGSHRSAREPTLMAKAAMNVRAFKDQAAAQLCSCCYKPSPMYSSSSPNSSRHSISVRKSHSQLDAIAEVDSEAENNRKQCSSVEDYAALGGNLWNEKAVTEKAQRRSPTASQSSKTKMQKSLEDSCADFLNIVCDNVTESVQKSIDTKLQEFITHATEKFTLFTQQLEGNGTVMGNLFQEHAEKMAEKNKKDLEEFYVRIQDLLEKQHQAKCNETHDNENKIENTKKKRNKSRDKEHKIEERQTEQKEAEAAKSAEEVANNAQNTFNSHKVKNVKKCDACHCCFEEGSTCHLCTEEELIQINQAREMGGCQEIESTNGKGEVKQWNSCKNTFSKPAAQSSQEFCAPQASPQPPYPKTLTNLCLTTSGKINCLCNLSTHNNDWAGHNIKSCAANVVNANGCAGSQKSDIKLNSPAVYDNYDTSGYATEPEDNSEATVNSSRKRLQKKSCKQHNLKRQISTANSLEPPDNDPDTPDDDNERSSFQATKRLSRSSLKSRGSSPTRLSRL